MAKEKKPRQFTIDAAIRICKCGENVGLEMLLPYILQAEVRKMGLKDGDRVKVTIRRVEKK